MAFEIGQTVWVTSGGPSGTVSAVDADKGTVTVAWPSEEDGHTHTYEYEEDRLQDTKPVFEPTFEIGETVYLNSGSPELIVETFDPETGRITLTLKRGGEFFEHDPIPQSVLHAREAKLSHFQLTHLSLALSKIQDYLSTHYVPDVSWGSQ